MVDFFYGSVSELVREPEMRDIVLRDDKAATGVLVEAMHDSCTSLASDATELPFAMMEQGVDESVFVISRAWVHDQIRGFV